YDSFNVSLGVTTPSYTCRATSCSVASTYLLMAVHLKDRRIMTGALSSWPGWSTLADARGPRSRRSPGAAASERVPPWLNDHRRPWGWLLRAKTPEADGNHRGPASPRLQQCYGVRRWVIGPFATTPTIQDQEIKRPVLGNHVPVPMQHRHVGQGGKERLTG